MDMKKKTTMILYCLLLVTVLLVSGCVPDIQTTDEEIEDTLKPTKAPDTAHEPTPTPEKTGFNFTDKQVQDMYDAGPLDEEKLKALDDYLYAIYINNDYNLEKSMYVYEFHYDGSKDEARTTFGNSITGDKITADFPEKPIYIEEGTKEEIEVRIHMTEEEDGTYVFILRDDENMIYIPGTLTEETTDEIILNLNEDLSDKANKGQGAAEPKMIDLIEVDEEKLLFDGISYYPKTGSAERFGVWETEEDVVEMIERLKKECADALKSDYVPENRPEETAMYVEVRTGFFIIDVLPIMAEGAGLHIRQMSDMPTCE